MINNKVLGVILIVILISVSTVTIRGKIIKKEYNEMVERKAKINRIYETYFKKDIIKTPQIRINDIEKSVELNDGVVLKLYQNTIEIYINNERVTDNGRFLNGVTDDLKNKIDLVLKSEYIITNEVDKLRK